MHGGEKVEAYSAGSRPSGVVNPLAVAAMQEKGYDLMRHRSKTLKEIPDGEYEVAVSMGCGDACPLVQAKRRVEWAIPDPKTLPPEEFRSIRDLIERQVVELLGSL
jgi:protein-tyrosine-phosphatase